MVLTDFITKFESYLLTEKRVSHNTHMAYRQDLQQFMHFCQSHQIVMPEQIKLPDLKQFLSYLKNKGISARSVARKIATIKGLFMYGAARYGLTNYAQEIHTPKIKRALPSVLSEQEIEALFAVADTDKTLIGKRNRTMLYLMYVTGVRVTELISIKMNYLQRDNSVMTIEGKGEKQRMIPIPDGMMGLLISYIDEVRPQLLKKVSTSEFLFPVIYRKQVKALTRQAFWMIIQHLWKKAGIKQPISPHTLRHSFATHMLQKGANLRSLQILLGHEQLNTVQIYTQIDTRYLRDIYNKKHPRSE